MRQYLLVRIAQLVPVLFLASVAIWALMYLLPGDPVFAMLGPNATPEQVTAVRAQLGFDQPVPAQYLGWLGRVLHGNFGVSYQTGLPVPELIGSRAIDIVRAIISSALAIPTLSVFIATHLLAYQKSSWIFRVVTK